MSLPCQIDVSNLVQGEFISASDAREIKKKLQNCEGHFCARGQAHALHGEWVGNFAKEKKGGSGAGGQSLSGQNTPLVARQHAPPCRIAKSKR